MRKSLARTLPADRSFSVGARRDAVLSWHEVIAPGAPRSMSEPVRFLLNGQRIDVGGLSPQTTLLEYLREVRRLTGTKEGCAEGDCGACTVVLGEPDGDGGSRWKPVNACIRFLPTLDGKALFTVEDLRAATASLHPVQHALVECHGSQCGFCTPGFVMSPVRPVQERAPRRTRRAIDDALSGQSVPLHRLSSDRRRGAAHVRPAARDAGWRGPGVAGDGSRIAAATRSSSLRRSRRSAQPGRFDYERAGRRWFAPRDARRRCAARCARASAGAHSRRRAPTSACGSPSSSAISATCSTSAMCANLRAIATSPTQALEIGAAVSLADAFAALDARMAGAGRGVDSASRRCRSATPARSAATSPTARRSATRCRR